MKCANLLLLALLLCFRPGAQKLVQEIGVTHTGHPVRMLHAITGSPNTLLSSLVTKNGIERYAVDLNGGRLPLCLQFKEKEGTAEGFPVNGNLSKELLTIYQKYDFIAGVTKGKRLSEVLKHPITNRFLFLETNLTTGQTRPTDTLVLKQGWELFCHFEAGDSLIVIARQVTAPRLVFHTKSQGSRLTADTVSIDWESAYQQMPGAPGKRQKPLRDLFSLRKLLRLPENEWIPTGLLRHSNRAYVNGERLTIHVNPDNGTTLLLTVNLRSRKYALQRFLTVEEQEGHNDQVEGASLLIDSLLITAANTGQAMYLRFYSINSGSLLKETRISDSNFNRFATGIEKSGDFWSRNSIRDISFPDFLRKARSNQLQLTGYSEKGKLFLTLGTTYTLFTITNVANAATLGTLGFFETNPPSQVSFHTAFLLSDLSPVAETTNHLAWEKIVMHIATRHSSFSWANIFYLNGVYYLEGIRDYRTSYQLYGFPGNAGTSRYGTLVR